jgi:hypothetical protein
VVPELPDCSAFGATPEAAVHEIGDATLAWIAACRASGDPVPRRATRRDWPDSKALVGSQWSMVPASAGGYGSTMSVVEVVDRIETLNRNLDHFWRTANFRR